jgi:hypothetical protein
VALINTAHNLSRASKPADQRAERGATPGEDVRAATDLDAPGRAPYLSTVLVTSPRGARGSWL